MLCPPEILRWLKSSPDIWARTEEDTWVQAFFDFESKAFEELDDLFFIARVRAAGFDVRPHLKRGYWLVRVDE